jgi:hypothetical protein
MEEPYFYTGRVPISLRHIINSRDTRKESTIEAIGGQVHSHLLTFSAKALKRRSEAITPGGRHDIKAAWTEQKEKPHPKAAQTPDANKKPGTPNNSPAGGAGPSSANGREPTQRNTQQKAHDTHGGPKSARIGMDHSSTTQNVTTKELQKAKMLAIAIAGTCPGGLVCGTHH